ncbi:hypothetical protein D9M70_408850 [compost metagenome]
MALRDKALAEAVVADRDAQPCDEAGHARQVQQPQVHGLAFEQRGEEAQRAHRGGRQQGHQRHAVARQPREDARRAPFGGQVVEHAGRGVHAGIAGRQHRGQDHRVHHAGGKGQAGMAEHQRERAHAHGLHIALEQAGVGVGDQDADDQDRQHIEQQDAPEHLAHRARDVLRGVG